MKAYLIDATARTITPFDYERYGTFTDYLPGGLCIGHLFANEDVLYVDDLGLLRPAECAFRIKGCLSGQPLMSNGILTGRDTTHTTLPPTFSIAEMAEQIEWLTVDEALDWFRARQDQPAVASTTSDGTYTVHAHWSDFVRSLEGRDGYDPKSLGELF
jgi:hypothetical protein